METPHKHCRTCGELKPETDFHFTPSGNRRRQCKTCAHRRKTATRNLVAENARRRANPAARAAAQKRYREAHPEQTRALRKRSRERAGAQLRERLAAWRRRHPGCAAPGGLAYLEAVIADPCAYCGRAGGEFDHIDPVSAGGSLGIDNITSACRSCNARKNATPLLLFLARR